MDQGVSLLRGWLDGRQTFPAGVLLLTGLRATPERLLELLAQGENPFTKRKLRAEVQRLADERQLQEAAPPIRRAQVSNLAPAIAPDSLPGPSTPAPPRPATGPAVLSAEQHAELAPLRAARLAGFKRASYLKSRLELMADDETRRLAAVEIRQLWRANQKSWDDEQYYLTFGFFPPEAPPRTGLDRRNPAAVLTRRNTLRTYLSTKRSPGPKQAAWCAELLELDRILAHE